MPPPPYRLCTDILDSTLPPTSTCSQITHLVTTILTTFNPPQNSPPPPPQALLSAYIPLTNYPSPEIVTSVLIPLILSHPTPFTYHPNQLPTSLPRGTYNYLKGIEGGIGGLLRVLHSLGYNSSVLTVLRKMEDLGIEYLEDYGKFVTGGEEGGRKEEDFGRKYSNLSRTFGSFVTHLLTSPPCSIKFCLSPNPPHGHEKYPGLTDAMKDAINERTPVPLVGLCNRIKDEHETVRLTGVMKCLDEIGDYTRSSQIRRSWVESVTKGRPSCDEGKGELWVRGSHEVKGEDEVEMWVEWARGWGGEGWDFIRRSRDYVSPHVWRAYVVSVRSAMGRETEGWGCEELVYQEGGRWGYDWEERDREVIYDGVRGDLEGTGSGEGLKRAVMWRDEVGNDEVMESWIRIAEALGRGEEGRREDGDVVMKEMEGRRVEIKEGMGWVKGGEEFRVRQGFRGEGKTGEVWLEGVMRRNKEAKR